MKKLLVIIAIALGSAFVNTGAAHANTGQCNPTDSNPQNKWGVNSGNHIQDYAGLVVQTQRYDAASGNYVHVNVDFTLYDVNNFNGAIRSGRNAYGSAKKFQSGDTFYTDSGSTQQCTGFTVLGYGGTYANIGRTNSWGNRYFLDCTDQNNASRPARFKIKDVGHPTGHDDGYWVLSNGFATVGSTIYDYRAGKSPKDYFEVINGGTKHVVLTWRDNPRPVPPPKTKNVSGIVTDTNTGGGIGGGASGGYKYVPITVCNHPSQDDTADRGGIFNFELTAIYNRAGPHFCVNAPPAIDWDYDSAYITPVATNQRSGDPGGGTKYTDQVAHKACQSYGSDTSQRGFECTGWGSGLQDDSHIGAETSNTYGGGCSGTTSGTTDSVSYDTSGNKRNSPYSENEKCTQTRTLTSHTGNDQYKVTSHYIYTQRRHIGGHGDQNGDCAHYSGSSDGHVHTCTNIADTYNGQFPKRCSSVTTNYPQRCVDWSGNETTRSGQCNDGWDTSLYQCTNTDTRVNYTQNQNGRYCDGSYSYSGSSGRSCSDSHTVYKKPYLVYPWDIGPQWDGGSNSTASDNVYNYKYTRYDQVTGLIANFSNGHIYGGFNVGDCRTGGIPTATNSAVDDSTLGGLRQGPGNIYNFIGWYPRFVGFCLRDPQYLRDPQTGEVTDGPYLQQEPGFEDQLSYEYQKNSMYCWYDGGWDNGSFTYPSCNGNEDNQDKPDQHSYNFIYTEPNLAAVTSVQSVNGDTSKNDGANVKPGDNVTFKITLDNSGFNAHDVAMEDFVPQNIDPSTIVLGQATIKDKGRDGSLDTTTSDLQCNGSPSYNPSYTRGYNCYPTYSSFSQYANPCSAASCAFTPNTFWIFFNRFPTGAHFEITLTGKVRPASQVGVFPADYRFCNNPSNWSVRGNVNSHSDDGTSCEDYTNGLQAVSNFARVSYHWDGSQNYSNHTSNDESPRNNAFSGWILSKNQNGTAKPTINPIPGSIGCIGKTSDAQPEPNATVQNYCGTSYYSQYVESPGVYPYDQANITMNIQPDRTLGPVEYKITDQTALGAQGTYNGTSDGGRQLDPVFKDPVNYMTPNSNATDVARILRWINKLWSNGDPDSYAFNADFQNVAVGYKGHNTSSVCYPEYWTVGYPVDCRTSNTLEFYQVNIVKPHVASDNGDVHAGGGIAGANCGVGSPETAPNGITQPKLDGNPGAHGRYFVAASGTIGQFSSTQQTKIANYGVLCRPDLVASVSNYVSNRPADTRVISGTTFPADHRTDQRDWDGKVIYFPGDLTIDTDININSRFTLFVGGRLYIAGNIRVDASQLQNLYNQNLPSFGAIVKQDISINHNVTRLDGLFSSGTNVGVSRINTCADGLDGNPTLGVGAGKLTSTQCSNQLVVRGLLMANTFRLNRTNHNTSYTSSAGDVDTSGEYVDFNNVLFTATPPGFSDLTKTYLPPVYLGEKRPRY